MAASLCLATGCSAGKPAQSGASEAAGTAAAQGTGALPDETEPVAAIRTADPSLDPNELLKPPPARSTAEPEPSAAPAAFDVDRWVRDQGVVAELEVESCELATFPAAKGKAIWCERVEEDAAEGTAVTVRSVYVPRDQKLAKVADVAVAAGSLELANASTPEGDRYWVKLDHATAADGGSVSFSDSAELGCDRARAKNAEFTAYVPDQGARRAKAIERICNARGRYGWSAGSLRKLSGQPR